MDFIASQRDMNNAYLGGATGVLASGLIWGVAGVIAVLVSNTARMLALFFGGMLIFPLSVVFSKLAKRTGKHAQNNALKHLAIENLGVLFVGLFLAFAVAQVNSNFFYPIMLLSIGARYLMFQTLYGLTAYWLLGGVLILAGALVLVFQLPFVYGAFIGSAIEMVFSLIVYKQSQAALSAIAS